MCRLLLAQPQKAHQSKTHQYHRGFCRFRNCLNLQLDVAKAVVVKCLDIETTADVDSAAVADKAAYINMGKLA